MGGGLVMVLAMGHRLDISNDSHTVLIVIIVEQ